MNANPTTTTANDKFIFWMKEHWNLLHLAQWGGVSYNQMGGGVESKRNEEAEEPGTKTTMQDI